MSHKKDSRLIWVYIQTNPKTIFSLTLNIGLDCETRIMKSGLTSYPEWYKFVLKCWYLWEICIREEDGRRNYFVINLHESMGPGRDQIPDLWVCSQTRYHLVHCILKSIVFVDKPLTCIDYQPSITSSNLYTNNKLIKCTF